MTPSSTVRQWLTRQDGLDQLTMGEASLPTPGEDEVLVEIHSVSLNYRDIEVCIGEYNHHESVSHPPVLVPCSDMCGIVVARGPSSHASSDPHKSPAFCLGTGDRVISTFAPTHLSGQVEAKDLAATLGGPMSGVLTQYRIFPTFGLVKVPDYLSDDEAACLPIAALTAWMSMNYMQGTGHSIRRGEKVVCQGTGGVSISAVQIAAAAGAHPIVTSSSDAKLERAAKLGAKEMINYRTCPRWDQAVLQKTDGRGADVIIEVGGAQTLRKSFDCVRFGGLISCIGYLSGKQDNADDRTNTNLLCLKRNVTLKGIINGPRDELERMLKFYDEKKIRPVIDRVFPFDEADQALSYLFSGRHFGKVVVRVKE